MDNSMPEPLDVTIEVATVTRPLEVSIKVETVVPSPTVLSTATAVSTATPTPSPTPTTTATPEPTPLSPTALVEGAYDYLYSMMDSYATGNELRLIDSYTDNPADNDDTTWVYDNSLVILAFLARGSEEDLERAQIIADALVYAQENDPDFDDGRIRDAYHAAQFINSDGTVSIAAPGSATGNMAWASLALIAVWEQTQEPRYLEAAERLANWIVDNTLDERGSGGYSGGIGTDSEPFLWLSTEHNADLLAVFNRLYAATGDPIWQERAEHAQAFLEAMWNEDGGYFWTGTKTDGIAPNPSPIPEDTQSWTLLALEENEPYLAGLDWALANLRQEPCPGYDAFVGLSFSDSGASCSFEATAHMALVLQLVSHQQDEASTLLTSLRNVIVAEPEFNGGLVAAPPGGAPSGFGFAYPHTAHIGATAWYLFAEQGYNPFSGQYIPQPTATEFQSKNSRDLQEQADAYQVALEVSGINLEPTVP